MTNNVAPVRSRRCRWHHNWNLVKERGGCPLTEGTQKEAWERPPRHWESQARDAVASDRGQSYIHHEARDRTIALFVRTAKKDPSGRTIPYFCAGTATYVEHQSERPIQITWKLDHPLPGDIFASYRAAVA